VAQSCTLPWRRFATCAASGRPGSGTACPPGAKARPAGCKPATQQVENLRYHCRRQPRGQCPEASARTRTRTSTMQRAHLSFLQAPGGGALCAGGATAGSPGRQPGVGRTDGPRPGGAAERLGVPRNSVAACGGADGRPQRPGVRWQSAAAPPLSAAGPARKLRIPPSGRGQSGGALRFRRRPGRPRAPGQSMPPIQPLLRGGCSIVRLPRADARGYRPTALRA